MVARRRGHRSRHRRRVDIVGGISYDRYDITKAEDFTAARGLFEYPKGGADAFNWQSGRHLALLADGASPCQRVGPRALPGHLRAVQHAIRHGDAESGSGAGARDESGVRLEGTLARAVRLEGDGVLQ